MTITSAVREAIREAVETAHVAHVEEYEKTRLGDVHFTVAARAKLQRVVSTPDRLLQATAACEPERHRQILEEANLEAAWATYALEKWLTNMQPHKKVWVMDPDGTLRPIDLPE